MRVSSAKMDSDGSLTQGEASSSSVEERRTDR